MRNKLLVVVLLVVGCADDGGSGPGPGVDSNIGPGGCTAAPDNCTAETICVNKACVAAFPRVYGVTNVQLTVPTTDPAGAAWDVGGGAPDLFITVAVNGTVAGTSGVVADSFSATFAGPFDVQLIAGSTLRIDSR